MSHKLLSHYVTPLQQQETSHHDASYLTCKTGKSLVEFWNETLWASGKDTTDFLVTLSFKVYL